MSHLNPGTQERHTCWWTLMLMWYAFLPPDDQAVECIPDP